MNDSQSLKKLKRSELEELIKQLNSSIARGNELCFHENRKNSIIEDHFFETSPNKLIDKFFDDLHLKETSTVRLILIKNDYFLENLCFSSGINREDFGLLDEQIIQQIGEKDHLVIQDTSRIHNIRFFQGHNYPRSLIAFPILQNGKKIAIVWIGDLNYQAFNKQELEKYEGVIDAYRLALAVQIRTVNLNKERLALQQIVAKDKLPIIIFNLNQKIIYANHLAISQFDLTINEDAENISNYVDFSIIFKPYKSFDKPKINYKEKEFDVIELKISKKLREKAICCKFLDKTFDVARGKYFKTIISTITNYLRSPMIEIKGLVSLISALGDLSGKQLEFLSQMKDDIDEIEKNITRLLSVNQIDKETFVEISEFSVDECVEKVTGIFLPLTQQKQIAINISKSEDNEFAINDENLIKHALLNVLEYAIKETHMGGTIEINHKHDSQNHFISINDSGKGISSFDVKKLMEEKITDQKRGELEITRDIMSILNGDLLIESNLGSGSTITMVFPRGI